MPKPLGPANSNPSILQKRPYDINEGKENEDGDQGLPEQPMKKSRKGPAPRPIKPAGGEERRSLRIKAKMICS
jgi:hypothetical protein